MLNLEDLLRQRQAVPSMLGDQAQQQIPQQVPTMGPVGGAMPTGFAGLPQQAPSIAQSNIGQPISSGGVPAQTAQLFPQQGGVQSNPVASQQPIGQQGMPQQMPSQAQGVPNQARWDAFYAQQGRTRPTIQRPQPRLGNLGLRSSSSFNPAQYALGKVSGFFGGRSRVTSR